MLQNRSMMPGVGTEQVATSPREVLLGGEAEYLPKGKIIAGAYSRDLGNTGYTDILRAGLVMGKRTSDDKYAPSIIGVISSSVNTGGTNAVTVNASTDVAGEIYRRIGSTGNLTFVGPGTGSATVQTETVTFSAISGGSITCVLTHGFGTGTAICPADGSETPRTIFAEQYGKKVTDSSGANIPSVPFPEPLIGGVLNMNKLIGYDSVSSGVQTWLKQQLRTYCPSFVFSDDFGT